MVATNIAAFGGDPTKVTIWGESAGAISTFDQLALYDGNMTFNGAPLFRAAVMDSGNMIPAEPVDGARGQAIYDTVLANANCTSATDTLACLRGLSYSAFVNAAITFPSTLPGQITYVPRPDGAALSASPEILVQTGKYAQVPMIVGDQEDEGATFFDTETFITNTSALVSYLGFAWFPTAARATVAGLVATYPNNAAAGSPFRTGSAGERYPEYKRLAAMYGDFTFTLQRRWLLAINRAKSSKPAWSYLATYLHLLNPYGTYHGTDLVEVGIDGSVDIFASHSIMAYYISFFNTMDPNAQVPSALNLTSWPSWGTVSTAAQYGNLMDFGNTSNTVMADNFRNASYAFLTTPANILRV